MRLQAHTSNLANCIFLPPGSAVVELIQRFWTWMALDKSFKDQTDQLADVHHFAWRAHHVNQTVYLNPRDRERCGAAALPARVLPRVCQLTSATRASRAPVRARERCAVCAGSGTGRARRAA